MTVHDATGTLFLVVWGILAAERAVELVLNRIHVRWLVAQGARFHEPDGFGLILLAQVLLFALVPLELLAAPWSGTHAFTWPLLALALAAQGLRYWAIATLGPRWCIRVATLPGTERVLGGPYRWVRHPNYLAVATEALVLPLAFGAYASAAAVGLVQVLALARRIRIEDAALERASAPQ